MRVFEMRSRTRRSRSKPVDGVCFEDVGPLDVAWNETGSCRLEERVYRGLYPCLERNDCQVRVVRSRLKREIKREIKRDQERSRERGQERDQEREREARSHQEEYHDQVGVKVDPDKAKNRDHLQG